MKKILLFTFVSLFTLNIAAQDIPQHISYTRIYDFLDELAGDGFIELNSAIKPYSRMFIAQKLQEAQTQKEQLNKRQHNELMFFFEEFALEINELPEGIFPLVNTKKTKIALIQPAIHYRDENATIRITPLLGMHVWKNENGTIIKRWYGAELQSMIGKHLSVYGSLRDNSFQGGLLSKPDYLNNFPGAEYKESNTPGNGDFSDSRGGIKYAWKSGSIGLVKDNVMWGDNYHGSNILSGRAPSFPMLTLNVKPVKWFELNYFHGWLVANVIDSTRYYTDNQAGKHYRNTNKFIAANMFTFMPVRNLHLSVGNSVVYSESNVQPSYFIPVAFYKSMDHVLTKGLGIENQNSQVFLNFSSRNIKHVHLYGSVYVDEVSFPRFKSSNPQNNPISYKVGTNITNFPLKNLFLTGEFTNSNIINYKHSIPTLTWTSNSYNLGHYLGDNSQEIYLAMRYKPIRGLDLTLSYTDAKHGKEYDYIRSGNGEIDPETGVKEGILSIISQPSPGEIIWTNKTIGLNLVYEIFNNAYAIVNIEHSDIRGHENEDDKVFGEKKMTAQETLDYFTPAFLQGKNTTIMVGFSIGF